MARTYVLLAVLLSILLPASAAERVRLEDYALVLDAPAAVAAIASRKDLQTQAARARVNDIHAAQAALRAELARRNVRVTGAVQTLLNAVFVRATAEQAAALRAVPGVRRVAYLPPIRRHLNRALDLVKATGAWNALGGMNNAGAGIKIGIIDTGIDQNHPGFQDSSLAVPPGFPKGPPQYRGFTNSKVIVARSYESMFFLPDDPTPRDRVGHGTAVAMIAAGVRNTGPAATVTGMAPKAWLGNYKVFGSPGVNDNTRAPIVIQALEDAFNDGMDIVTLSLGNPASYGPLDRDTGCGDAGAVADCDVRAQAVEAAVRKGMTVVVSAGNDADTGQEFPALSTINTPGTAPSGITVGASTNSHVFFASLRVTGDNVPADLREVNALFGDGPKPDPTLTAPLRDVATLQDNGRACASLTSGSLAGAVALIERGDCTFSIKVNNAQAAGAVGVVIYQSANTNVPIPPVGLTATGIPAVMIGGPAGAALKVFLRNNPDRPVTLDPGLHAVDAAFDTVADFSSRGPSIGEVGIKPELVAVGTDLYTATQTYDPNADMYDRTGYTAVSGTSLAGPLVAGAAALVKQRNPRFTPAQIKSALVNTATQDVRSDSGPARIADVGAGKLNAAAAVAVGATVSPAVLSFGQIGPGTLPASVRLDVTNTGTANAAFNIEVAPRDRDTNARVAVSPASLQLNAGQQGTVTVQLQGNTPAPGTYEGFINIAGGGTTLKVPYVYLASDGVPYNIFPVINGDFDGAVNDRDWLIGFKLVDRNGLPVAGKPVQFRVVSGGGAVVQGDAQTFRDGIAAASVDLGPVMGEQVFSAEVAGFTQNFYAYARQVPAIMSNGVINSGSLEVGRGLAPGSYATIRGAALSDVLKVYSTKYLPLSLAGVSVSFEAQNLSLPGHLHFVSDKQINVQIPWEFQGLSSAKMYVNIGNVSSSAYTVPLVEYAPAAFEYDDPASGRRLTAARDLAYQVISIANPARRGRAIQIYANGLGPVDNQPASGEPSLAQPLSNTLVMPTVTIGGRPAQVLFSGLAPDIVALYQINVTVPEDAPAGVQPVVIRIGDAESKPASLPVQ